MAFDAATYEIDPLTLTTPRARLEYLRDFLRRLPRERFYIGNYVSTVLDDIKISAADTAVLHQCGTAACIAGWAAHLFSPESVNAVCGSEQDDWGEAHYFAAGALGLTDEEACQLFVPLDSATPWRDIAPTQAAAVIDHLLKTGEVDWSVATVAA